MPNFGIANLTGRISRHKDPASVLMLYCSLECSFTLERVGNVLAAEFSGISSRTIREKKNPMVLPQRPRRPLSMSPQTDPRGNDLRGEMPQDKYY